MVIVLLYRFGKHMVTNKNVQMDNPIEEFTPLLAATILYMINLNTLIMPLTGLILIAGIYIYHSPT